MTKKTVLLVTCCLIFCSMAYCQKFSRTLLKADQLYIKKSYQRAVQYYEKYLAKNPRDFYASRQAAHCYAKLDDPAMAIDYWPAVIENAEASETDNFEYARCLLANYRTDEARRVFISLSRSTDKAIAIWGQAYLNPARFFRDSALCRVTEVNDINSPGHEYGPVVFHNSLFYISDLPKKTPVSGSPGDEHLLEIYSAAISDSVHFQTPLVFHHSQARRVNGPFCFSGDGATIYMSIAIYSKDLGIKNVEPFYRFQLYTAPADNPGAMQPFKYNSPDHNLTNPCISRDGQRLYFASDMKGTLGGKDIFVCELVNGEWGSPVNLGPEINSPGQEAFPYITDEGILYFVSDNRPGLGGLDLFAAKPSLQGARFQEAQNAGAPINTQFDDYGIYLLPGGKTGYLSSNRKNNTDDDIFYFRDSRLR